MRNRSWSLLALYALLATGCPAGGSPVPSQSWRFTLAALGGVDQTVPVTPAATSPAGSPTPTPSSVPTSAPAPTPSPTGTPGNSSGYSGGGSSGGSYVAPPPPAAGIDLAATDGGFKDPAASETAVVGP